MHLWSGIFRCSIATQALVQTTPPHNVAGKGSSKCDHLIDVEFTHFVLTANVVSSVNVGRHVSMSDDRRVKTLVQTFMANNTMLLTAVRRLSMCLSINPSVDHRPRSDRAHLIKSIPAGPASTPEYGANGYMLGMSTRSYFPRAVVFILITKALDGTST